MLLSECSHSTSLLLQAMANMLADAIDSSLSTLQQGLNGVRSSSCNPLLLDTALSVLQLSTTAVHQRADDDENADEVSDGYSSYFCVQQQHQQRKQKDLKFEASARSLRSAASGSPRHSNAGRRRSVSFKEARDSPLPAVAAQRDSGSASVTPSAHGCELVVELRVVAAGLLSEALAGSSPTHLEVDLLLHEAAAAASSTAQQVRGSASAAAVGAEGACTTSQPRGRQFVRTPSGGVVRRTGSDAGTLLSPSGKEVWVQVRGCRACACALSS